MSILLTDSAIQQLLDEAKPLGEGYLTKLKLRPKTGHKEGEFDIQGVNGSQFRLILRQSLLNILDFSVILGYTTNASSQVFRLRRYNGKSHEHTNKIEPRQQNLWVASGSGSRPSA